MNARTTIVSALAKLSCTLAAAIFLVHGSSRAAEVDFNTFIVEDFPRSKNPTGGDFDIADWLVEDGGVSAREVTNASNTVFYGPDNVLNSRITGVFSPGTDDDMPGFVLGFNPGDAQGDNPNASYLVIDWKGADQQFDFTDPIGEPEFHELTAGTFAPAGLAISRVDGLPTADELWGHVDDPDNPEGSVTELARGFFFGDFGYDRTDVDYEIEILYQSDRVEVFVDGDLELELTGSFGDGRFGLYEAYQNPGAAWAEFDIELLGTRLEAGDANQDLKFDQLDLVQVQQSAKYLTGQAATWGQGDWNGAPGGGPGNPPAGNGFFDQLDVVAALTGGKYLTGPYAAINTSGRLNDDQTTITYDPRTGELGVDAPSGRNLTSINIDSAAAVFTGEPAQNLGGSFDNDSDTNVFKATFGSSFGSLSFGNVAQPGLSEDFVASDLTVIGSLEGGGDLGPVDLLYVPEPATAFLAMIALMTGCFFVRASDRYSDSYVISLRFKSVA